MRRSSCRNGRSRAATRNRTIPSSSYRSYHDRLPEQEALPACRRRHRDRRHRSGSRPGCQPYASSANTPIQHTRHRSYPPLPIRARVDRTPGNTETLRDRCGTLALSCLTCAISPLRCRIVGALHLDQLQPQVCRSLALLRQLLAQRIDRLTLLAQRNRPQRVTSRGLTNHKAHPTRLQQAAAHLWSFHCLSFTKRGRNSRSSLECRLIWRRLNVARRIGRWRGRIGRGIRDRTDSGTNRQACPNATPVRATVIVAAVAATTAAADVHIPVCVAIVRHVSVEVVAVEVSPSGGRALPTTASRSLSSALPTTAPRSLSRALPTTTPRSLSRASPAAPRSLKSVPRRHHVRARG